MGSTRALFASIGVSVSLVAAAALSLFTVSVVIAFGGWSAGMGESKPATTLIFGAAEPAHTTAARAAAVADRTPVVLREAAAPRPRRAATPPAGVAAKAGKGTDARVVSRPAAARPLPATFQQPVVTPAPAVAEHKATTGDGVRRAGEDLSSAAHSTGKALSDATAPLGPPVSAAVQKVLDLVAVLLQRTTNGLGGTLDKLGQR
jgi:hypothetical protein